ncbi:MAG TPA: SAM-dependent methyltransferase [Cyanobacteria bacterium UBA8803]|nr:SAM-dependent methyltransferase [Cyanobacteria bacterium UBA9273]HBL61164.1 SAM-dependent methyltransferase [Cyanobacteria bacterium UBA8803]
MMKLDDFWQKIKGKIKRTLALNPNQVFPLTPELPLPAGISENELFNFVKSVLVSDAPPQEMANYCQQDFRRFVYTYGLVKNLAGNCLELGANPYFTTMLIRQFTQLELSLANYFGSAHQERVVQEVYYKDFNSKEECSLKLESSHFNIENDSFPFRDEEFDVVLFCEIIEHLLIDPIAALKEIKRILKPKGVLVITTPNVNRLENVCRMISGANIYDPYSGYGPYGRHNREYNRHDLYLLLDHLGFSIDFMFTADVHQNEANGYCSVYNLKPFLKKRQFDLGQYIFVRAINDKPAKDKKPAFLYRSLPPDQLE